MPNRKSNRYPTAPAYQSSVETVTTDTPTRPGDIITYVPQAASDTPSPDMGTVRRAVWLYTHKLGLEFTLVLILSLGYQVLVAIYIGIRALRNIPLLAWIPTDIPAWQLVGYAAAILAGVFVQGLLVAELAQVVWMRRTDRLKIRLMSDSIWWWVHLGVLVTVIGLDFLLLFMAVTGTTDIGRGWHEANASQMTFIADMLLTILNMLTLLRCAAVMRTSTSEENRREVEERLTAIADELLLDAGDATREQAQQVWRTLNADPRKFLPLQDAVLDILRRNHPDLLPSELGGDTWCYDFTGNTFAALPPDLHLAMSQSRGKRDRFSDEDQRRLWSLPPLDVSELIAFNFDSLGRPRFVDLTDPTNPEYVYHSPNFEALVTPPGSNRNGRTTKAPAGAKATAPDPLTTTFADRESFLMALEDADKVRFASYLKREAFRQKYNEDWTEGAGVEIWKTFDLVELQYLYKQWLTRQPLKR
jgi:hypothetical protein